jgi:beta-glucosidase-like glycosyl hydrolase
MGQRALKAIVAGADMVLLSSEPDAIPGIVAALRKALRTGKLPRERAQEALAHVQAALDEAARLRSEATACGSG